MPTTRITRMITRETGMALAVLALWMLSLLAPLHQTSGVLREMARAGQDISGAWSICVTLAQDDTGAEHLIQLCPAKAIGKTDLAAPPPVVAVAAFAPEARTPGFADGARPGHRPQDFTPQQPRAPPTLA